MDPNAQYIGYINLRLHANKVWLGIHHCIQKEIAYQPSGSIIEWKFEFFFELGISISYGSSDTRLIFVEYDSGSDLLCSYTWNQISSSINVIKPIVKSFKIISKDQGRLYRGIES